MRDIAVRFILGGALVAAIHLIAHGIAEHVPVPASLATGLAAWLVVAGSGGYMATMLAATAVTARAVIVGRRSEPVTTDQEEGSAT